MQNTIGVLPNVHGSATLPTNPVTPPVVNLSTSPTYPITPSPINQGNTHILTTTTISIKRLNPENRPLVFREMRVWVFGTNIASTLNSGQFIKIEGFGNKLWRVEYKDVQMVGWITWTLVWGQKTIDLITYDDNPPPEVFYHTSANTRVTPVRTWGLSAMKMQPAFKLLHSILRKF